MNMQDKNGNTALLDLSVSYSDSSKYLEMLTSAGCDVNIGNNNGHSVINKVIRYSYNIIKNLKLLYAAGANVNRVDINGHTPAHHRSEILPMMFAAGENIEKAGQDGICVKQQLNS